jgi:pyrimidine-nucleoside phosphorylase
LLATAIIDRKRDSCELSRDEIQFMLAGLVDGTVPDYQISAWAMAVLCRGMTQRETADLTDCMLASGNRLPRASDRPRVDKHSTGGLGDKVSLILAPLLACFDLDVPMLSGRGLGITGGTLDKLESYAGFRCDLTEDEINRQLVKIGCVITGTTPNIAPADRKLYALRDVTGTVPSIPLITASIMSKKLSASLDALVLDVKCGSGAFMKTLPEARELAASLVATGERMEVRTMALLTDMSQPLGRMVGNACEANEAVEILSGHCELGSASVRELTLRLCAELLVSLDQFPTREQATTSLSNALSDGRAMDRYEQMISEQGGTFCRRIDLASEHIIVAEHCGWVQAIDGERIGRAVIALGGGRQKQGDRINPNVGIEMLVRIGEPIAAAQPMMRVFADDTNKLHGAKRYLAAAITISDQAVSMQPLLLEE